MLTLFLDNVTRVRRYVQVKIFIATQLLFVEKQYMCELSVVYHHENVHE